MKQLTFFIFSRQLFVILLACFGVHLTSCNSESGNSDDFDPNVYLNTIENSTLSFEGCEIENGNCTHISIFYPVFNFIEEDENVKGLNKEIQKILLGSVELNAEDVCKQFIQDYSEFINDPVLNEENYDLAWYDVRTAELISVQKRVISFKCSFSSFYGGAHPGEYVYLRNINPNSGDSLGLGMIFNEEALKELSRLGERFFRKSKDIGPKESLEELGFWFDNDSFELSANFAFTDQGLWFYYNDYEIAPYSMGHSEFLIPYNLIMHLFEY